MSSSNTRLFAIVAFITASVSIFAAVLMTDVGQVFALPRSWILSYYRFKGLFIGINLALLAYLWWLHLRSGIWRRSWMMLASVGVVFCIISANFVNYNLFPTKQRDAIFRSIAEADELLEDDQILYAVEINGEVRGFPRDHLEIPHVAGATIGGEDVAMTFCGLSNLPVVIDQDIGHGESDFGVMAQTNNNLILIDHESGDLIQQITMDSEFTDAEITTRPNTMMPWRSFKELYPEATVFIYDFDRALDPMIQWAFAEVLQMQFDPDAGTVFPTVDLTDDVLNPKEQVWGYDTGTHQVAFTRTFAHKNPIYNFQLAGRPLVLVYDASYDILALFSRELDGQVVEFETIDFRGVTEAGRLQQLPTHNGVFWMVWSHFHPETQVFN